MTESVRAVVFDIDDTLYLERDYVRSGFRAVGRWAAENLGVARFGELAWAAFERGVRGRIFDVALEECGVEAGPSVVSEMVRVYREHAPDIALLPDARACLDALAGALPVACITDGPLSSQRNKARVLGLLDRASPVVFTAELGPGRGKPDPAAFRLVEETLGLSGRALVYVADNPAKDFAAPRALGWRTIRVRRSGSLHEHVPSGDDVDLELRGLDGMGAVRVWHTGDAVFRD